jgi:hypothetical protein
MSLALSTHAPTTATSISRGWEHITLFSRYDCAYGQAQGAANQKSQPNHDYRITRIPRGRGTHLHTRTTHGLRMRAVYHCAVGGITCRPEINNVRQALPLAVRRG